MKNDVDGLLHEDELEPEGLEEDVDLEERAEPEEEGIEGEEEAVLTPLEPERQQRSHVTTQGDMPCAQRPAGPPKGSQWSAELSCSAPAREPTAPSATKPRLSADTSATSADGSTA
jgi:hypothetical protein